MDVKQTITEYGEEFEGAVDHFRAEAAKLRTGRAHPSLVEDIAVDYYGTKTPIRQIASVSVPEPRQLVIQPWDRDSLVAIAEAIRSSDLGLNPADDGHVIRLTLPQLTEERRKELVKVLGSRLEEARISVRTIREEIWKEIQDAEKKGEIGEDDKFSAKDLLQKRIDEVNALLDGIREKKEGEIMTV